jgi:hypothetical protein
MTLKEAFPQFTYLHLMQGRLDKAGHSVEDFIQNVIDMKNPHHGGIPIEIYMTRDRKIDMGAAIRFMGYFGWSYLATLIAKTYPEK